MGLEKYRKQQDSSSWGFREDFDCPQCHQRCSGKNTAIVNKGKQIARWCKTCKYFGVAEHSPLDNVSLSIFARSCRGYP